MKENMILQIVPRIKHETHHTIVIYDTSKSTADGYRSVFGFGVKIN